MKKRTPKPTWKTPTPQTKTDEKKRKANSQHPIGNFAPNALMDSVTTAPASELPVQPKLTIGQVGDKYEQEADAVAAKVVQQINTPSSDAAQTKAEEQAQLEPALQRQDLGGGAAAPELEAEISQAKGGGQALDKGLQRSMGNAMGMDLSHVKVHTDSTAHQLNQSLQAKAFTTGQDVFFGKGQYQPGSKSGQELIAHELAHVGQQTGAGIQRQVDDVLIQRDGFGLFQAMQQMQSVSSIENNNKEYLKCVNYLLNVNGLEKFSAPGIIELIKQPCQKALAQDSWEFMNDYIGRSLSAQELYDKYIEKSQYSTGKTQFVVVNLEQNIQKKVLNKGRDQVKWSDFKDVALDVANRLADVTTRFPRSVKIKMAFLLGYQREQPQTNQVDLNQINTRGRREARTEM